MYPTTMLYSRSTVDRDENPCFFLIFHSKILFCFFSPILRYPSFLRFFAPSLISCFSLLFQFFMPTSYLSLLFPVFHFDTLHFKSLTLISFIIPAFLVLHSDILLFPAIDTFPAIYLYLCFPSPSEKVDFLYLRKSFSCCEQ